MSVNLSKNKAEILAAWKDVLDEKTTTDWALFGYEGLTNNLMVVSKGDGGIDEMKDDLNSGTVMYAFCKVIDPKTSLRKYVLINWQGEGAPLIRKGVCANHVRDVANTLKGFHVTLNARTEEDVDSDLIIEKVEKSASSSYSFDERLDLSKDGYQKVDPAYKKVEPRKEINPAERDKFWAEDEEQEKQRQQEELRRKQEEQLRLEKEQMEREAAEASKREQIIIESSTSSNRNNIMDDIRRVSELRKTGNNIISEQNSAKSEELRKLRNKETEELISKRTINARAIFEQNTSFGQLMNKKQITNIAKTKNDNVSPIKEINKDLSQDATDIIYRNEKTNETLLFVSNNGVKVDDHGKVLNNFTTTATDTIPVAVDVKNGDNNTVTSDSSVPIVAVNENLNGQSEMVSVTHDIYQQGDYNLQAEALYDYQAADETEISFDPGDIITHIEQIDPGWWQGLAPDGSYGLFPANYVQLL